MDAYQFGYPRDCHVCVKPNSQVNLRVEPFYQEGKNLRVMLIGQDPTIGRKPERVKRVLMLDEPNGQLSRWLKGLFGKGNYESLTIYATNLVKCTFDKKPSSTLAGGYKFLKPYFENCKKYLIDEIRLYKPHCVLALGEPAHRFFITILDNKSGIPENMKEAFTGNFIKTKIEDITFDYSPCLHIQTWRVAETYGESVIMFKEGISEYFKK